VQLARHEGFTGNHDDYYEARNSYLNHVIERRRGIPITLCLVIIELARRVGVPAVGIGMPGHFLVRDGRDMDAFADPFNGVSLDRAGCEGLFSAVQPQLSFDDAYLAPVGPLAIVTRPAREPGEIPPSTMAGADRARHPPARRGRCASRTDRWPRTQTPARAVPLRECVRADPQRNTQIARRGPRRARWMPSGSRAGA